MEMCKHNYDVDMGMIDNIVCCRLAIAQLLVYCTISESESPKPPKKKKSKKVKSSKVKFLDEIDGKSAIFTVLHRLCSFFLVSYTVKGPATCS